MSQPDTLASASADRIVIAASIEAALEVVRREQSTISAEIRAEQAALRAELKKNTEATTKIKELTEEMVTLFDTAKGFFKVAGWVGNGLKWIAGVAAALVGLWVIFKGGFPPRG